MVTMIISFFVVVLSFNFFMLSYQINGINRLVLGTPIALFETAINMYNIDEIRAQFPMLSGDKKMQGKPLVFLDNCSTTFKPQCVIDAIERYYRDETSNSIVEIMICAITLIEKFSQLENLLLSL